MKKFIVILLFFISVPYLKAQISIGNFNIVENDLDARNYPVLDDEGSACALVKIITTAKGFNFEIGQLPVKKVDENKVGEIWVYVPDGTMKMKISHQDLGSLKGPEVENGYFMFPQRLKRAKVYRLELTHDEVVKLVGPQIPVSLTFKCDVNGAEVILGEGLNATSAGYITNNQLKIPWPKGQTVKYRIKKDRYEDLLGTYTAQDDENSINIKLKPLFGNVTINTLPEANIYINGVYKGKGKYNDNLDLGNYTVKVSQEGYREEQRNFSVDSGERKYIEILPDMIFGSLDVSSNPSGADVYIDGEFRGKTPYNLKQLIVGHHSLSVKKYGYEDWEKNIKIDEGRTNYENIKLSDYAKITIYSSIPKSFVYVNDRYVGITPYKLSGPAGKYKIKVENGIEYATYNHKINLNADSKNIYAKLGKNLWRNYNIYLGARAGIGTSALFRAQPFGFLMGIYIKKFNFEFDWFIESGRNDITDLVESYRFLGGYSVKLNHRFRFTAQTGLSLFKSWDERNVFGIPFYANFDLAIAKWLFLNLRTGYDFTVSGINGIPMRKLQSLTFNLGIILNIGWGGYRK